MEFCEISNEGMQSYRLSALTRWRAILLAAEFRSEDCRTETCGEFGRFLA